MIDLKKIKKSYAVDLKAETQGKWFPLALMDGVKVKVARIGNPIYQKRMQELYRPYAKSFAMNIPIPDEVERKIQNKLLTQTLWLDWEGMPGEDGEDVPFSKELALELIEDPTLKELRDEVMAHAGEFRAFQAAEDKETEGN